jgi:uncharacterized membrane protein
MLLNHTALYLATSAMEPVRHIVVYWTLIIAAPVFLFVSGFCLNLSHAAADAAGVPLHRWMQSRVLRAALLIALGWALNLVVAPGEPIWSGGILQTIGLATLLTTPVMRSMQSASARAGAMVIALAGYVSFLVLYPLVSRHLGGSSLVSQTLFDGFPPWPWISVFIAGSATGGAWLGAVTEEARHSLMRLIGLIGLACIALYAIFGTLYGAWRRPLFERDLLINGHWLPGPVTSLCVIGTLLLLLWGALNSGEARTLLARATAALGRHALLVYVVHLLLICAVLRDGLHFRIDTAPVFIGTASTER